MVNLGLESRDVGFFCRICKQEFTERERFQYEHHIVKCADEHADVLLGLNSRLREWNSVPDPEWESWNADLRARGINPDKQYDKKLKKSAKRLRES